MDNDWFKESAENIIKYNALYKKLALQNETKTLNESKQMKHKHAELIKAWADGAEIEWYNEKCGKWILETYLSWGIDNEYRVKSAITTEIEYYRFGAKKILYPIDVKNLLRWDLKITSEDGLPIKAEFPELITWEKNINVGTRPDMKFIDD